MARVRVDIFLFCALYCLISLDYFIVKVDSLACFCEYSPGCDLNGTCHTFGSGGRCFALVFEEEDGEEYWSHGCVTQEEGGVPFMCMGNTVATQFPRAISCCDNKDFCNEDLEPPIHLAKTLVPTVKHKTVNYGLETWEITCIVLGVVLIGFSFAFCLVWRKWKQINKGEKSKEECLTFNTESHVINEVAGVSSGSGSGQRILVQRTIGRETELKNQIGKGRYGEVWRGIYKGDNVAVKILPTTQEASYYNECELYRTLNHDYILKFIMNDILTLNGGVQMLIVTAYHDRGSLYDYIGNHDLDLNTFFNMTISIMDGLQHLHSDITGTPDFSKISIAHRDLKSKNILVKENLQCCICDLGLAVRKDNYRSDVLNTRQGTVRYMAPEVLGGYINKSNFESLLKADMYSVALVFWEMLNRCCYSGQPNEHQIPYFNDVSNNPSFKEMTEVVCTGNVRPQINPSWLRSTILSGVVRMMEECWHGMPAVRISSLRFRKTLENLRNSPENLSFVVVQ